MEIVKTHIDGVLLIKPRFGGIRVASLLKPGRRTVMKLLESHARLFKITTQNHRLEFCVVYIFKRNILRGNLFRFPLAESLMSPSISAKNPEHLGNGMALSLHKKINGNYG